MKFVLFQTKEDLPREYDPSFMSYDFCKNHNIPICKSAYNVEFKGDYKPDKTLDECLEALFVIFNTNRPANFTGRSMSVSDVIAVIINDFTTEYYYVDSFGFKKLENF